MGLYVAVEALVCALLGGKGEGGGTGGQAEDVGVGLHGEDLLVCCGVGSSGVLVGFDDVVVVSSSSASMPILIPFV